MASFAVTSRAIVYGRHATLSLLNLPWKNGEAMYYYKYNFDITYNDETFPSKVEMSHLQK